MTSSLNKLCQDHHEDEFGPPDCCGVEVGGRTGVFAAAENSPYKSLRKVDPSYVTSWLVLHLFFQLLSALLLSF
jgi:hypothetical protein